MTEPSMENCLALVLQKDVGRRLQVGQEIIDYILDKEKSHDLEQDQTALDKMVDGIASSWVNSSHFKVNSDLTHTLTAKTPFMISYLYFIRSKCTAPRHLFAFYP